MKNTTCSRISRALLVLVVASLSCGEFRDPSPRPVSKEFDRPSVLLVTLDTTRRDRLGVYGSEDSLTPNLDRIGQTGVIFEDVRLEVPITLPAHTSILSGLRLREHGVRENGLYRLDEEVLTLPEALSGRGYRTAAFISSFVLDDRFGLAQGFAHYDDEMTRGEKRRWQGHETENFERPADETTNRALRWLETQRSGPLFMWVHYFDPHEPYEPRRGLKGRHPYDAEVAFMDAQVGRLIEGARAADPDLLVVIASDHGENLGEDGRHGHGKDLWEPVMRGVLLMQHPEMIPAGTTVRERVVLADVLATVLDLAGIDAEPPGRSLVPAIERQSPPAPPPAVYMETVMPAERFGLSEVKGILEDDLKLIWWPQDEKIALFDVSEDPQEQNDLIPEQEGVGESMLQRLRELDTAFDRRAQGLELDEETRAKLKALGYLGGGGDH